MAAGESDIDARIPVILRIKRRRHGDAADALVVSHAKLRKFQDERDVTSQGVCGHGRSVFHFAGTLGSSEASSSHVVLQKVSHQLQHKTKVKHNPFAKLTISDKRQQAKEEQKMLAAQCRYKLIARNRGLGGGSVAGTSDVQGIRADDGKDHKADLHIMGKGTSHSKSNLKDFVRQMVQLYDLVQEGGGREGGGEGHSSQGTEKEEGEASLLCETITCNGTEMVRERVTKTAGQGAEGQVEEKEEDFVYDVYYSEESPKMELEQLYDWSSLTALPESELVHDVFESDEDNLYDDEDDSNAEDNWRNEYPDEERDSDASSDSLEGSDNEDICRYHSNRRYRHREAIFDDDDSWRHGHSSLDNWYVANADRLGAVVMERRNRADSLDDEDDEPRDYIYS